jgi:hypothetical protein
MTAEKREEMGTRKKLPSSVGVRASFSQDGEDLKDAVLRKKADLDVMMLGGGGMDTTRIPITYVDPMFDPVLTLFPKENIRELNRRLRHYYTYHPVVRNVIDTHVEFSLSDFDIVCKDPKIAAAYLQQKEDLNLVELFIQGGRDYNLLGEAFLYGQWDDERNCWKSFLQYPPENIEIYKTYVGEGVVYLLKPDEELKKTITGTTAAAKAIAQLIPDDFKSSVLSGKPYQLKNSQMIHLARRPAAYVPRGVSLVTSVLKYLLMEDKMYLLLLSNIDRNMTPIKIWKIGEASRGLMPTKKQINEFRTLLIQAMNDPDFNIVTHPFVNADFVTPVGKMENLMPYFEFIYKRLLVGLFASDEFMKGSTSPYATAAVSAKLVMQRYLAFRTRIENIIRNKIFKPIAIARNYVDKDGNYILPTLKWKSRNLLNEQAERELMMRLRDKGEIPFKVISDLFGMDFEAIKEQIEAEKSTVFDPVYREAEKEKAKDKLIIKEVIKGKTVKESVENGIEADERVTKPGRPSMSLDELKTPTPAPTSNLSTPPRSAPLETGKETKPLGGEKPPETGGGTPPPPAPPAGV